MMMPVVLAVPQSRQSRTWRIAPSLYLAPRKSTLSRGKVDSLFAHTGSKIGLQSREYEEGASRRYIT